MTSDSLDETQFPGLDGSQEERVARRVAELFDSDAQFRAAAPVPEVIEAVCTPGITLPAGEEPWRKRARAAARRKAAQLAASALA